ncbi:phage tail tape measure protein [uncultured Eubacterium sp.]|uniref:phage tail tape measure protein n=1 Tax=uncultured Eubacterium sp. TaxID=165185 RepID=UPI002633ECD9|nr:phage tail tape measure protein [uncultured Eubacterium sp.]
MAKDTETTAKFKADITELKSAFQEASRQVRLANSEFKAATAGMDNWNQSADGLSAKITQLNGVLSAQKSQLSSLEKQYELTVQQQGANSKGAEELEIKINQQKAAIGNTEKQLKNYTSQLDDLKSESGNAESESEELADSVEKAGDSAENSSGGFSVLKGALANLVSEGINKVLDGLKDLTTDSSNAYSQFAAATGTATDAMDEYQTAIENVYKNNFGDSLEDVAGKMAKVKEITGEIDPTNLQTMTEKAMTLEDVFGMDMSESLRGVQSLMDHFGISSEEAFDLMSSGAQQGLNFSDELGDNIAEYAGKFAEAGFSADEYFQYLQNGSQGGAYNLDKVNDSLNEVTTRLADGTIEGALDSFDSNTQEVFKAWQDGKATQQDVVNAIVQNIKNTTNEQDKMNLAATAFGTMAEDGGTKFIESLSSVGDSFDNVKGKADELADIKYDTPQSALQGIGRTLKVDMLQPIVDKLMPYLNKAAAWVTANLPAITQKVMDIGTKIKDEVVPAVKNVFEWIQKLSPVIAAVGTAIAGLALVGFIQNFKTIIASTKLWTAAQWLLNAAMSANPIALVVIAIAALVAAFVVLWNKSEAFRNFWIGLWDNVKAVASTAWEAITGFFSAAWDTIKAVWDVVLGYFQTLWAGIQTTFSVVSEVLSGFFSAAWNAIKAIWDFVVGYYQGIWNGIKAVFSVVSSVLTSFFSAAWNGIKAVWNAVVAYYQGIWNGIKAVFSVVSSVLTEFFSAAWNGIKGIWDAVSGYFSGIWESVKSAFSGVESWFQSIFSAAWTAVQGVFSNFGSFFQGLWDTIKSTFSDLGSSLADAIGGAVRSGLNGVLSMIESTINNGISLINGAIGLINALPGVNVGTIGSLSLPRLAKGGIVDNATTAIIGEDGKEAVIPLERNTKWIDVMASKLASKLSSGGYTSTQSTANSVVNNFYQTNNSPKALSRLEIYRQSRNLLNFKGV